MLIRTWPCTCYTLIPLDKYGLLHIHPARQPTDRPFIQSLQKYHCLHTSPSFLTRFSRIRSSFLLLCLCPPQEWDQVSAYSNRSIPRPRIYSTDHHQGIADDLRSHISHFSGMVATKPGKARSIADGQSQHSVSNHSHRGYLNSAFPTNLVNSRPGTHRTP